MILVKDCTSGANKQWVEKCKVEDIDALLADMSKALEGENASRPRKYEVIEIDVKRRVLVEREVSLTATVNVKEDEK